MSNDITDITNNAIAYLHNHSDSSNLRLLDCTVKVKDLIDRVAQMGSIGVAITDHESLSSHITAITHVKKQKENNKLPKDFKLILGNEIYLVDSLEEVKDNYQSGITKFYHFILLAKDKEGHRQLRELSSLAWNNSFFTGKMERVPTIKTDLEKIIKGGHVIGSTACLGGQLPCLTLKLIDAEKQFKLNNSHKNQQRIQFYKVQIHKFITWCLQIFGKENFFIELQPSLMQDQIDFNTRIVDIAKAYGIGTIITTDTHYLSEEDRSVHEAFLKSKEGDREVLDFYNSTYLMTVKEIISNMDYLNTRVIEDSLRNTIKISSMIEDYDLYHPVVVPRINIPEFKLQHRFKAYYDKLPYIKKFAYSQDEQNRYYLYLVENGVYEKEPINTMSTKYFESILSRINMELGELYNISNAINTTLSSYYITVREIINIIWNKGDSLVGVGRGSVGGWQTAYYLDIIQINPMQWGLPHWRHLSSERPELPDIDIDSQQSKRQQILYALQDYFGKYRVVNICTFGTEGSRSALLTACRGLGIDIDEASSIASLVPTTRGSNWSLSDCVYGDVEKDRKPVIELINKFKEHERLQEVAFGIEGLINKRSIHASGVYVFPDHYVNYNATMKAPNGQIITQYDMESSDYMGGLKVDLLTIKALDKIRLTLDSLIEDQHIQWQGSLKSTYDKYIHPDVLNYDNKKMWSLLETNDIIDLFQFDTDVGSASAQAIKPKNLIEMATANSVMRLSSEGTEQPIDTYVKYKNDISLWYKEMRDYNLSETEIKILEKYLLEVYGVADTQEVVMEMSMDKNIANFTVKQANILRKSIAKKKQDLIQQTKDLFYKKGRECGTSDNLLHYVWDVQISRQLGYSFSKNHTFPYSCIGLQEMNLAYYYPRIYWNTACLTVNAGADENNQNNKNTDYGKIAKAIGEMQSRNVKIALPNINIAKFAFSPDLNNNRIIFGLKGISDIGDDVVNEIIKHRPYKDFNDFLNKVVNIKDSIVKQNHVIQLIKAGAFDEIDSRPRENIMKNYVYSISDQKTKLNMQNFPSLLRYNLIPEKFALQIRFFNFRKYIYSHKPYKIIKNTNPNVKKKIDDKLYLLDNISTEFYIQHFDEQNIIDYVETNIIISAKAFDKEYNDKIEEMKKWIMSDQTLLKQLNFNLFKDEWDKHAKGTISKWEMDSLSFYYHEHELQNVDTSKYGIVDFFSLPQDPVPVEWYTYKGNKKPKFKIDRIAGTVLDKNKYKHTVSLLTTNGVVDVKFYRGAFNHYDKQISVVNPNKKGSKKVIEKSWFARGNKLLIAGFRRDKQFIPRVYYDTIYNHTVALITNIEENGDLTLRSERKEGE